MIKDPVFPVTPQSCPLKEMKSLEIINNKLLK